MKRKGNRSQDGRRHVETFYRVLFRYNSSRLLQHYSARFFDHKQRPFMERLIYSDSTVTQLWNAITRRFPEYGGNMFSEASVLTRATWYKVLEIIWN
jgi:hypothetical protein